MKDTSFRLTQQQEEDLVDFLLQRLPQLQADNKERLDADKKGWDAYNNDQKWRIQPDGVFRDDKHNLVLPLTSMVVESFISRSEDSVTSEDTLIRCKPQGPSDVDKASQFEKFFRFKFEGRAKLKGTLEDSFPAIFVQRAAVFKTVWSETNSEWIDYSGNVLFDAGDGTQPPAPVKYANPETGDADFVYENETPWAQAPTPDGQGIDQVLEADPSIVFDPNRHSYAPLPSGLRKVVRKFRGARAKLLDYDTFLCPSTASSIEDADVCAELYDKPLPWIESTFLQNRPWCQWKDYLTDCQNEGADPKTETDRKSESKENLRFDQQTHMVKLVEFWVRRDVLGWGRPQEFMVIVDTVRRKAIYYEYQGIICPDLERPYVSLAIGRMKDRWWGYSLPEKLDQYQQYCDLQFNREGNRNERVANPIGVWHPDLVEGEPENIHAGGTYRAKKKGTTAKDFASFTEIPDLDTRTHMLIEFIMQLVQLWLGVSNLSQGNVEEMPANTPKFGIEQTLREASKLGRRWIRRIIRGFEALLNKLVKLELANLDEAEPYTFLEGKDTAFAAITPDLARDVEFDVKLVVSQETRQQDIQAAQTALAAQREYFATPPVLMPSVRPIFEKILNALGFTNMDELLPVPMMPPPGAPGAGAPPAAAGVPEGGPGQPEPFPGEQPGDNGNMGGGNIAAA